MIFEDRHDSGKKLAELLLSYKDRKDAVVLGLPRGGVVTAYEVSKELNLPLDVICPMKIPAPFNHEYAIGAILEDGQGVFDEKVIRSYGISDVYIQSTIMSARVEALARLKKFRQGRPKIELANKTIILVDDGMATGLTMRAAIQSLRKEKVKSIVVAIPVAPPESLKQVKAHADLVFCLEVPLSFYAVGQFYSRFDQTSTDEVVSLLKNRVSVTKSQDIH
jgi:putative phosphoribosyl transferase